MKTITVEDNVWKDLSRLKIELMSPNINSVISYLLMKSEGKNNRRKK